MFDSNKTIKLEIVTPEKVVSKEDILQITVPTLDGEITVLPKHIPLISILKPGVIEIKTVDGRHDVAYVAGGFIEVLKNKIVILADSAIRAEEIDVAMVEDAKKRAKKRMEEVRHEDTEQFADLRASLARELAKTKAVVRWKKIKNLK